MLGNGGAGQSFPYYGQMAGDPTQDRPSVLECNTYPPRNPPVFSAPLYTPPAYWNGVAPFGMQNGEIPQYVPRQPQLAQNFNPFYFANPVDPFAASYSGGVQGQSNSACTGQIVAVPQSRDAPPIRYKRKTLSPPRQKCKQLITEEKMAEHMSRLQIASETAPKPSESASERTVRLYMCEQMRQLQADSILPKSILSTIQRPCTALVLWQPPQQRLLQTNQDGNGDPDDEDDNNGNNNQESIPDHNKIAMDSSEPADCNSMDLDGV